MIVPEDYAKGLLARYGLKVPAGGVASTPGDAARLAETLGGAGVVKALIPAGGRGKAGGVRVCHSIETVREAAVAILDHELLGHKVDRVLVETLVHSRQEIYAGISTNFNTGKIDIILGLSGGMDVESAAQADGSMLLRMEVEPEDVLPAYRVIREMGRLKPAEFDTGALAHVLVTLHRAAADLDATLLEINPLSLLKDGSFIALDCKLEVDDNALFRHSDLLDVYTRTLDRRELRARELGVSYVPLDGDIGVITSGAGLGMATLDLLKEHGLSPANFLDTGGGISESLLQGALELILEPPVVRGAIINLYGGINRMLEAARGIVAGLKNTRRDRPIVVKILGNQQEEAWEMLESKPNVQVIRVVHTEVAVKKLAALVR
jgi:succinyl-CoA synthetase beta subunit